MQWTKCFGGTLLVILGLSLTGSSLGAAEPTWKVGTAKAVITPEKAMWLAGYGHRDRPSDGKLTDLWVKVLALEAADGTRGVVVTSDLLGFPEAMYETIYERLHKQHGLERSQLMLTCSHTHSSPVLSGALYDCYPLDDAQRAIIDEYSKHLVDTVVATVNEALGAMTPATLWSGQGSCDFAVNRRKNREADVVKLRQQGVPLRGPSDHDVPVLVVRTPEGKPRAVVFGYACHSTTLCGYEWCGDYSGYTQIELEKAHPGLQAMFYIGCGADQNPLPRRSVELCQKYGTMLTASVEAVLAGDLKSVSPKLKTAFEFVEVGLEGTPTHESLKADTKIHAMYVRRAERIGKLLDEGVALPKSCNIPVQAWKLGDQQLWITIGGEVVVDYDLMCKQKYGPKTWVAGYTNYVMSYVPSERVWKEGGYEANAFHVYGVPASRWAPDIQKKLTSAIDQLVNKL